MSALLPVKSSNIEAVGYDPADKTMRVRFKGGAVYSHAGVDAADHRRFVTADSQGKHYHAHIKGRYPTQKVENA